jgi:hypothetical protein
MQSQPNDIEIILSEPQTAVLSTRKAVILDMAGQGGGKSQNIGYSSGMFITDFPEALGFIGANTYMQLSQSTLLRTFETWKETYGFTEYHEKSNPGGAYVVDKKPPPHFHRIYQLRDWIGTVSFYNGALIFLGSLDNWQAHDGKEFAWAHLDETKDTKENALKQVIMARLRQYGLWYHKDTKDLYFNADLLQADAEGQGLVAWNPLYIHTSPSIEGTDWLNKLFSLDKFEDEIKKRVTRKEKDFFFKEFANKAVVIYPAYHNAHNLPPNYIENRILDLADDDQVLKLVDGFPFGKSGGEYFPAFRKDKIVRKVPYMPGVPVHASWDFNVVPYMTLICAQIIFLTRFVDGAGNKYDEPQPGYKAIEVMRIRVYKAYCLANPHNTTEATCEHFAADHDPLTTELFYYGDASGLHRIPGLGSVTNFKIIEENLWRYLHNDSKQVKDPNVKPLTRRDLLNKIFAGKIPTVEIEIDEENCPELIDDLEKVKLGPKGKAKTTIKDEITKENYQQYGHPTDALECFVSEVCKHYIT